MLESYLHTPQPTSPRCWSDRAEGSLGGQDAGPGQATSCSLSVLNICLGVKSGETNINGSHKEKDVIGGQHLSSPFSIPNFTFSNSVFFLTILWGECYEVHLWWAWRCTPPPRPPLRETCLSSFKGRRSCKEPLHSGHALPRVAHIQWLIDPGHSQRVLLSFYVDREKLVYEEATMQSHYRTYSKINLVSNLILKVIQQFK